MIYSIECQNYTYNAIKDCIPKVNIKIYLAICNMNYYNNVDYCDLDYKFL